VACPLPDVFVDHVDEDMVFVYKEVLTMLQTRMPLGEWQERVLAGLTKRDADAVSDQEGDAVIAQAAPLVPSGATFVPGPTSNDQLDQPTFNFTDFRLPPGIAGSFPDPSTAFTASSVHARTAASLPPNFTAHASVGTTSNMTQDKRSSSVTAPITSASFDFVQQEPGLPSSSSELRGSSVTSQPQPRPSVSRLALVPVSTTLANSGGSASGPHSAVSVPSYTTLPPLPSTPESLSANNTSQGKFEAPMDQDVNPIGNNQIGPDALDQNMDADAQLSAAILSDTTLIEHRVMLTKALGVMRRRVQAYAGGTVPVEDVHIIIAKFRAVRAKETNEAVREILDESIELMLLSVQWATKVEVTE
jgi:hypothetical protein